MKFLPLVIAIVCLVAGWMRLHPLVIPVLALVNAGLVAGYRMRQVRDTPQRVGRANPVFEGAYLLVLNVLILAMAYFLGYFLSAAL